MRTRFYVHLLLVAILFIVLLPVIWMFFTSFIRQDKAIFVFGELLTGKPPLLTDFSLENYKRIFVEGFWLWLRNSFIVSFFTGLISTFIGFLSGYVYSRYEFPGRKAMLMSTILTQMFPISMMIVPFLIIANVLGILNTLPGLTLTYIAMSLPFSIWILKGFFDNIPVDIEDAAEVDGTTFWQKLFYIMFPLARPAIATSFLFAFILAWNEYPIAFMFISEESKYTLPLGIKTLLDNQDVAGFAAAATLVSLPVIIVFLSLRKELIESVTLGAVKE